MNARFVACDKIRSSMGKPEHLRTTLNTLQRLSKYYLLYVIRKQTLPSVNIVIIFYFMLRK